MHVKEMEEEKVPLYEVMSAFPDERWTKTWPNPCDSQ